MPPTVEMVPRHTLSFKEFVRLSDPQRKALGQVTIIPPELGKPGFGYVVAEKPVFVLAKSPISRTLRVREKKRG